MDKEPDRLREIVDIVYGKTVYEYSSESISILAKCFTIAEKSGESDFLYITKKGKSILELKRINPGSLANYNGLGSPSKWYPGSTGAFENNNYGLPKEFETYLDELRNIGKNNISLRKGVLSSLEEMTRVQWAESINHVLKRVVNDIRKEIEGDTKQIVI